MVALIALAAACVALGLASAGLAARWLPAPAPARDRLCTAALLGFALAVGVVSVLGATGGISASGVRLATAALGAFAWGGVGRSARGTAVADARALARALRAAFVAGSWAGLAWAGAAAVGVAFVAAALLAPWSWDGLGYHLPLVYDALQTGRLREVPTGVVYVNAYPHAADLFTLWWRCAAGDERWIDLAQLPFGFAAAGACAAMARRAGASAPAGLAWSLALLAVPAVALQLAANYVDVVYAAVLLLAAYFAVDARDARRVLLAGGAVGLLLATKPSAPPAAALLGLVALVRARRARVTWRALALGAVVALLGGGAYARNLWTHGNPVWPVRVRVAGHVLPGLTDSAHFFNLGVPEPYRSYGWLARLLASWFAWPERYVYDMRIGGFGPLFALVLLPLALWVFARGGGRRRDLVAPALAAACALATPGAFWARYTLAVPAALIACAAAGTAGWGPKAQRAVHAVAALAALAGLWLALPGFTDGGPALWKLFGESPAARAAMVSADGHAAEWAQARGLVGVGESFGYDRSVGLPGLLWREDGRGRLAYVSAAPRDGDALAAWARTERVRAAALGDGEGEAGALARARPDVFEPMFRCAVDACTVYRVR